MASVNIGNFTISELAFPEILFHERRRTFRKSILLLIPLFALTQAFICSSPTSAQVAGATLSGTITDPSEGSVPAARIDIENIATGVVHSVSANGDGFYTVPNLTPGRYKVTVAADGFSTEINSEIDLSVGAHRTLDFTRHLGKAPLRQSRQSVFHLCVAFLCASARFRGV
jgi:hypothetical protein